jgi:DNA transformation protein and related proteins
MTGGSRGPVSSLLNLGPKSAQMLADAGIQTVDDLRKIGPATAYARVKFLHPRSSSKNLLWSLAAGLEGRLWSDLTAAEKALLEAELARSQA